MLKIIDSCITCEKRYTKDCPCPKLSTDDYFGCKRHEVSDERFGIILIKVLDKVISEIPDLKDNLFNGKINNELYRYDENILITTSDVENILEEDLHESAAMLSGMEGKVVAVNFVIFNNGVCEERAFSLIVHISHDEEDKLDIGILTILISDEIMSDEVLYKIHSDIEKD